MRTERLELLARIAGLYYEENLGQAEIAKQTGYSRSMISRLLIEAREQRVVEIRINYPLGRRTDLEQQLQDALGLKTVRVLMSGALSYAQMTERLGRLAAQLAEGLLVDDMTIGVSWGTGVWETVRAMPLGTRSNIHVVQMIGALGTQDPEIDGPELARRLARLLAGRYTTLLAPLLVDSEATRQALMDDPGVHRVSELFGEIQLALVGVGTVDPERASLLRAGYVTVDQLGELRVAGAVGDVCAIHVNMDGRLIDTALTRRIVGIDAATLAAVPVKIGIAGGQFKTEPIIGASRAGLINMLVTDDCAATLVLQQLKKMRLARNGTHPTD